MKKDGVLIKRDKIKAGGKHLAKRKNKKSVIIIIAIFIVVLIGASTAAAGVYVAKLDKIFPNVTVSGTDLSGLTRDEAQKALVEAGYEKTLSNIAVTVTFPDKEKLTMTGAQSGLSLSSAQAAELAYNYGRDGSFFSNALSYIRSMIGQQEVLSSDTASVSETNVKSLVTAFTDKFNQKLMKASYTVTSTSVDIVKSSGNSVADPNAVYDLVVSSLKKSIEENNPITVDYTIASASGKSIDLTSIYNSIHKDAVEAVYDQTTKTATQSVVGVGFDITTAQKLLDAAQNGSTVSIPLILTQPKVSTEQLKAVLFRDITSEKSTYVYGSSNRVNNVKLAAAAVNGKILNPGETFSYNDTLGERTKAKGYKEAGAYADGQVVQEVGGGICQMSSMLYYSVLYSNLEVVDRSNHMFVVTYLPLGNDATVNWGTCDFKFKNNTAYPIQIESYYSDGYLTVRFHGTKTDTNVVKIDYVLIETVPVKTVQKEDASIEQGKTEVSQSGLEGYVVDTYKYIYDANGKLLSKTYIARSSYRAEDRIVLVPVGTLTSPSPSPSATTSAKPSASPTASTTKPSASPSHSSSATPSASASPSATVTPSASASGASSSPSPSPSESASASPTSSTTAP